MKKKIVKFCILSLALTMLGACGGKESDAEQNSKDYVYRAEEVNVEGLEKNHSITDLDFVGDKLYIKANYWSEEESYMTLISQKTDGSEHNKTVFQTQPNVYYSHIVPDGNGYYYAICEESFEDNSDPENYIWRVDAYLIKMDEQGSELWRQKLNRQEDENYWTQWIELLPDNRVVVCDSRGISLYDAEGSKLKDIVINEVQDSSNVFLMEDGTLLVERFNPETYKSILNKLNVDTGELSEDYNLPANAGNFMMYAGRGYDLFMVGNGGVFGYNLGDTEMKKLMDFVDSDIPTSYIYSLAVSSDREFYGLMDNSMEGGTQLVKFTKVDPQDVADKKILTLACNHMNWYVLEHVVEFNKSNDEYRIVVEEYSQYNTDEDYTLGATRLNTDIASGKIPDIILPDWQMPTDSYEAKGLFEDLYPYIEQDEELNKDDFFPNVLEAYENQGKLYRLVPSFMIYTVVGKTAEVGSEPGWTLDELNQLMATKPEGTQVFEEATRDRMLTYSMQLSGEQFINWETGECHFNTEEFIKLLEFLKQFPEQIGEDYYTENYWAEYPMLWRDGKVTLQILYLADFANYNYIKKGIFGEDITPIGFPVAEGIGSTIEADLQIVMSSKSKYKEGAWEFMRYFLTDEYQEKITYGWPINMNRIEVLAQNAMKKPSYEDENGNIVEYEQTYSLGGQEIPLELITKEEVDELVTFIKSVNQKHAYNEQLQKIVAEEAAPFFAGQKNAKEVADIIQSRVQIYVNENR